MSEPTSSKTDRLTLFSLCMSEQSPMSHSKSPVVSTRAQDRRGVRAMSAELTGSLTGLSCLQI